MSNSLLLKLIPSILLVLAILAGSPSVAAAKEKGRFNRITVGSVEIKDWHKGVVRSYPNLRHFHWNPMYSNVQGWNKVKPPRHSIKGKIPKSSIKRGKPVVRRKIAPKYVKYTPVYKRPKYIYKKPQHLPLPAKKVALNARHTGTQVRYIHKNPPVREINTQPQLAHKSTQPVLKNKNVNLGYSGKKPEKATTLSLHRKKTSPRLDSKKTNIKLASHEAKGSLRAKQVRASLVDKEPVVMSYKPYKTASDGMYDYSMTNTKVNAKISY